MRLKIYSAIAIVVVGLSFFSFAGSNKVKPLPDRDGKLAVELIEKKGGVLLDVRSQGEWNSDGHIKGAHLIPIQQLQVQIEKVKKLTGGDVHKPIVIYCRSGNRAGIAKKILLDAGYTQVTNVGGLSDWPKKSDIVH